MFKQIEVKPENSEEKKEEETTTTKIPTRSDFVK